MIRIGEILEWMAPALPSDLLPPPSLARIVDVAGSLPAALGPDFGFERSIDPPSARCDFVVKVDPDRGRATLALGDSPAGSGWARVRQLARLWNHPCREGGIAIETLMLEFDIADGIAPGVPPVPGVFVGSASPGLDRETVRRVAEVLAPETPLDAMDRRVRAILSAPDPPEFCQIGFFLSRPGVPVRLCFGSTPRSVASALARLSDESSWLEGEFVSRIRALLDGIEGERVWAMIQTGIPATARERVAVEIGPLPGPEPNLLAVLERFRARGLLQLADFEAIRGWSGLGEATFPHEPWWPTAIVRGTSHLKAVFAPERAPEVKAYFSASHMPLWKFTASDPFGLRSPGKA